MGIRGDDGKREEERVREGEFIYSGAESGPLCARVNRVVYTYIYIYILQRKDETRGEMMEKCNTKKEKRNFRVYGDFGDAEEGKKKMRINGGGVRDRKERWTEG